MLKHFNIGVFFTFSLFTSLIFQIVLSALGLSYSGSDESPLYKLTIIVVNTIVVLYVLYKEIRYSNSGTRGSILPYFIPLVVLMFYGIDTLCHTEPLKSASNNVLLYFFAFSTPGIYSANYCYRYDKFAMIARNLELLMFICALALIVQLPKIAAHDEMAFGGGSHQTISYTAAVVFGTLYCGIKQNYTFRRYKFFTNRYYPVIAICLLPLMFFVCIVGGGRGGMVLLIINLLVCTYFIARKHIIKILLSIALVAIFVTALSNFNIEGLDAVAEKGFERSFAYIGDNGIDWQNGSSGRDEVYSRTLNLIDSSLAIGYGPFYQYDLCMKVMDMPYCHNIFLEALLQGGVLYMIFIVFVIIFLIIKAWKCIRSNSLYLFLIPIITFPIIQLQFSGSYLLSSAFWFSIIFVYGESTKLKIKGQK